MRMPYDPWEHRRERAYDEQTPSILLHPNGSFICSYDRPFLNAAVRCVDEARLALIETNPTP